jgi:acetyl-CoA acyltransferase
MLSSSTILRATVPRCHRAFAFSTATSAGRLKNVVVVAGIRLPFAMTSTIYQDQLAVDLQRQAITGLLQQTALDPAIVDYVICGNVIQEVRTSNIAREAALNAGIPASVGGHTVAQACISANAAICNAAEKIMTGHADIVIAGGVETFSDVPIRLTRPIRQKLIGLPKVMKKGGPLGAIRHMFKGLKMKDIGLETPAIANFTTGEVMGVSSDRLAAKFGVSRAEQDEFTVRSHVMAAQAHADGFYVNDVLPYKGSTVENGIKGDSTVAAVGKLGPAFVKPHGTHTAANSSYLTDGAAASLIMSEEKAKELGYKPLAYLRDWAFQACDPFEGKTTTA